MLRKIKPIKTLFFSIVIFNFILGCKTVESPVYVDNTPISASLDLVNVINDRIQVEIKTSNINTDTISYYIPKIVPGTYQNNNFGKFIEDFKAFDHQGNLLYVQKYGDNRWKIDNAQQLSSITYWVNDTFDTENTHDIFSPTGTNIDKNKNFILNLYAFVGYFDKMKERNYKVFIKRPINLEASTSLTEFLPKEPEEGVNYDTDLFVFKRYNDVADAPIMYSEPDRVIFNINEVEVLLSVYSPNQVHRAAQLMPQMERMVRAQKNFLGSINTTEKYSVLLYLSSSKNDDAKGFGALEHNTSTVVVLPESIPLKKLNESLTDVVSHEFFHIVTPLSIHSEEIHNFDYNNPKMSKHLWLYEGTTEYFSILFQINQALITKEEFFERILEKVNASKEFDEMMSFATMSKNILKDPYRQNYRNVYEKGALISMCIDIIMREKSSGAYGILDLITGLSNRFGSEIPFKDDELINVIQEISYPEISDFLKSHVINNTPIDYGYYLGKVGLMFSTIEIPSEYFIHEQEPFIKGSEPTKEVVFTKGVEHNKFLKKSGIKGNDVLLSIDNKKYTIKNIYDLFSDSNRWKIGDDIVFVIKRDQKVMTLTSKVISPTVEKVVIKQNPNASDAQIEILKSWIND
ncbi:M61 family metallopeptidase [Aquimarina sp. 2201CG14-23]|uniref:M61 family metallopeptidase n=1 Tax=Aquimarina mycalae TaxID=3040073 RepID=UPI002477FE88|nr:peptidase M61 [Aquimarina sp. 2201CG14-23]MDH7446877.1 peptidase M61 [Aquimarina sp. 2201CG14-23]